MIEDTDEVRKGLWLIENFLHVQGVVIGFLLVIGIHIYYLYVGYIEFSMIYIWIFGILFGYIHSYLTSQKFLKDPTIYSGELEVQRGLLFRHPIKALQKSLRFWVSEWFLFLFICLMFIIAGVTTPVDYFMISFFLGLGIWGIFFFVFWKWRFRAKIKQTYGI
jgi:hypothetical protein